MIFRWGCGMPGTQEEAVDRIRRDHEHMLGLIGRIKAECSQSEKIDNCHQCPATIRHVCHGNIKQMVRIFVDTRRFVHGQKRESIPFEFEACVAGQA